MDNLPSEDGSLGSDKHGEVDTYLRGTAAEAFSFRQLRLVLVEAPFQDCDGGTEVVAERHQQVDVVEVLLAAEAVGEVVTRVDRCFHFAAAGAGKRTSWVIIADARGSWREGGIPKKDVPVNLNEQFYLRVTSATDKAIKSELIYNVIFREKAPGDVRGCKKSPK